MEPEVLAVVGGRDYKDKNRVYFEIDEYRKTHNVTAIASGVALDDDKERGADTFGRDYAVDKGLKYIGFPAEWDDMSEPCYVKINNYGKKYNALAGVNRNTKIIDEATHAVMAFWDGISRGTRDSVTKAKEKGKTVMHIKY